MVQERNIVSRGLKLTYIITRAEGRNYKGVQQINSTQIEKAVLERERGAASLERESKRENTQVADSPVYNARRNNSYSSPY